MSFEIPLKQSRMPSRSSEVIARLILDELRFIHRDVMSELHKLGEAIQLLVDLHRGKVAMETRDLFRNEDVDVVVANSSLAMDLEETIEGRRESISSDDTIDHNIIDLTHSPGGISSTITETNLMTPLKDVTCCDKISAKNCDVTIAIDCEELSCAPADKTPSLDGSVSTDFSDSDSEMTENFLERSGTKSLTRPSLIEESMDCRVSIITDPVTKEKLFECPFCNKLMKKQKDFKKHLAVHTGHKPHICMFCEKGFSRKGRMVEHMRTHTGDRPFRCDTCGRGFCSKNSLQCHVTCHKKKADAGSSEVVSNQADERFMCVICDKMFEHQAQMASHMRVHAVF
ncbi:unnamed protein product [Clavelina lepadiformis]|uniref:C2H2-type domain-containing protein n=1 Tax=Clavelina lepadiformis TaxID=159417 RepID=A0ABP0FS92_CLALP